MLSNVLRMSRCLDVEQFCSLTKFIVLTSFSRQDLAILLALYCVCLNEPVVFVQHVIVLLLSSAVDFFFPLLMMAFVLYTYKSRLNLLSFYTVPLLVHSNVGVNGLQDTFLPHVESGTIILVGATTENPSFHVNSALLSRCQVVVLEKLSVDNLRVIVDRALNRLGITKCVVTLEAAESV